MSDTPETETDTNTNTDEPSKAELHDRVEKLESTVEKLMPSRRDALKLGAAGIAGAAGLSATTQPADAATGSAGTIGSTSDRPDAFLDEANVNQLTGVSTGGIKTKTRAFLSSNSSANPIPLDSVSYDPDNNFDTNAHEYIVPADGTYLIALQVKLAGIPAGNKGAFTLRQNGSNLISLEIISDGEFQPVSGTDIRELSSGDALTIANFKNVSLSSSAIQTYLTVVRLA